MIISRWWFHVCVTPDPWGFMIQFDFRFFSWVETTTTPKGTPFDEIWIRVLTTSFLFSARRSTIWGYPPPTMPVNFHNLFIFRARASQKPSRTPLLVGRGYPPIYYQETKLNSGKSIVVFGCCPFFAGDLCACVCVCVCVAKLYVCLGIIYRTH